MKIKTIALTTLLASAFSFAAQATTNTDFNFNDLPETQKKQVAEYVSNYLVQNPTFLVKASENLEEANQKDREKSFQKKAELANQIKDKILTEDTPILKNKDAKFTIVVFADYNCSYCLLFNETLKELEKEKNVNIAFKELPIFGDKENSSFVAANIGINIFKERGIDAYLGFHNEVYDYINKNKKISDQKVVSIGEEYGYKAKNSDMKLNLQLVMPNFELGQTLGIAATPSYIIFGDTPEKTKFVEGYLTPEALKEVLNELK